MRMRTLARLFVAAVATQVVLSAQSNLPTPESVLGFKPGTDHKLATYDQAIAYFRKLDAASDRMQMVEAGLSTQGRPYYFALISSKDNLRRIDRHREIARRLAHPEGLTDAEAQRLAREGKPLVHIDGGLHSTEVAGPQHTLQLAYDLLSRAEEPPFARILDDVILMLWPTINPDGHQMVAEWQMKNAGTPNAGPMPGLYQEYVGHDNNRDAYMLNMIESRVMEHAWRQWEPQIIYVHHQSAPFPTRIWLPPFAEPIALHAPYLMSREVNTIGMAIAQGLEERGQVGATHMGTGYDAWYAGYIDYTPMFKNIAAFWTETQGNGSAPRETPASGVPANMRQPQALYASPWLGGTWRLQDQVDYMETASISVLDYAARYSENVLLNRYRAGKAQIEKHRREAPYAYVIPQTQRDPVAAVEMLRRLAFAGVRVSQLASPLSIEGEAFPAGTWVIPTDQEFIALAREVLDAQVYPDLREFAGGPPEQPYDAAGWTLPLQMGVRVVTASTPLSAEARSALRALAPAPAANARPTAYGDSKLDLAPFDSAPGAGFNTHPLAAAITPPAGRTTGTGAALVVDPAQNNAFSALNRAWKAGLSVTRERGPAGTRYAIHGLDDKDMTELVSSLALVAERATPAGAAMKRPRIALFRPPASMDEGWTRWVMERYGFEFTGLTAADAMTSPLRDRFDVIVISDEPRGILPQAGRGGGPAAAGGAVAGAGAGRQGAPPAPAGPTDAERVRALDEFVRAGGTLVCLNRSSLFAIDQLKLPVKNVVAGVGRQQFFANGSILEVVTDPTHPVMAGMPERADVFYMGGPVFETGEGFTGAVLARYQEKGSPLKSGYLLGETYLNGKSAALDVKLGDGHVVLIGFRPQWRGQPFGSFRVLFNALMGVN